MKTKDVCEGLIESVLETFAFFALLFDQSAPLGWSLLLLRRRKEEREGLQTPSLSLSLWHFQREGFSSSLPSSFKDESPPLHSGCCPPSAPSREG